MTSRPEKIYEFGDFRLDAREKVLWRGSQVADVTPRAVETLIVLVENAGRIIPKEEIFNRVWPDSFVEEANLTHHIFRLRKVLGEGGDRKFIETIPKRGYRFVAPVTERTASPESSQSAPTEGRRRFPDRFLRSKPLIFVGVFLVLGLVAALFTWKTLSSHQTAEPVQPEHEPSISRVSNVGKVGGATISPDGRFVAYMQNHTTGLGMLYVRQIETNTEVRLLPPGNRLFGSVSFSPDGGFIYYITFDGQDQKGSLYRIPVLGGQPVRLINDVGFMFTIAPTGERVAFFRDDPEQHETRLMIANVDGTGEETLLAHTHGERDFGTCPAWSPDGNLIAFTATGPSISPDAAAPPFNLYTIDIRSAVVQKLSDDGFTAPGKMVWKPDGSSVILIAGRPPVRGQLFQVSYPDGKLRRITKELNAYGNYGLGITADGETLVADIYESTAQLWSIDTNGLAKSAEQLTLGVGDGSRGLATRNDGSIVYVARTGDDFDLWEMKEANGRREGRPLTTDAYYESDVCVPPAGNAVIFASNRDGDQHLYRINSDGSGLRQLTFGETFDRVPSCSPDSSTIVYASRRGETINLWKIPVEGGEPVQLTSYQADAPSFSPDGKQIACILPSDSIVHLATLAVIPAEGGPPLKTYQIVPFAWNYRPPGWSADGTALRYFKTENMVGNLWEQKLSGGEPKKFTDFRSELIFNHAISQDGTKIIIARGKVSSDVVILKNFM